MPLRLLAKVDAHYSVVPDRLEFGRGRPAEQSIGIKARFETLRVIKAWSTHPGLSVMSIDEVKKSEEYRIAVHLNSMEWHGEGVLAEIVIESDSIFAPENHVPVLVAGNGDP